MPPDRADVDAAALDAANRALRGRAALGARAPVSLGRPDRAPHPASRPDLGAAIVLVLAVVAVVIALLLL